MLFATSMASANSGEHESSTGTGYRTGRLEKLLDFYSHSGYIAHKVHLLVAHDLEWYLLDMEDGEEILIHTFTLDEALPAARMGYRCDPEVVLVL
jgi:hypothetical protein